MAIDFNAKSTKVSSPSKLAHVVLRTGNFQNAVKFYKTFLGATATFESPFISFLTYDSEHHRIAIVGIPGTGAKALGAAGLEHIAFTFPSISDMMLAYRQRKAEGIVPFWCVNHGPTTSLYYQDPDGNQIETQVENFDTVKGANDFMNSRFFMENPLGVDFDPEELIGKLEKGVDEKELKKRQEIGPRGFDTIPQPPPLAF